MANYEKRGGCQSCKDAFDRCPACLETAKQTLKLKYILGKTPGRHPAQSRTGSSKRKNGKDTRYHCPAGPIDPRRALYKKLYGG